MTVPAIPTPEPLEEEENKIPMLYSKWYVRLFVAIIVLFFAALVGINIFFFLRFHT